MEGYLLLQNKNILLCVTGGIAVFKSAALTSKLVQNGANVRIIMSESAMKFVTPLTFQALSRHEVYTDTFQERNSEKIAHIDLAEWAEVILVAPATANIIGKLANGIADDLITTTLIATKAPVYIAPAMNSNMMENVAVVRNIAQLTADGYRIMDADNGYLACGYVGKGRMLAPADIIENLIVHFSENKILAGKKFLITAGPTLEKIDPVRYLSNFSSGKMGYALAKMATELGADVTLVTGPVNILPPQGVELIHVETAEEMYEAVMTRFAACDCVIKAAAVADYTPVYQESKMKKANAGLTLSLQPTKDILKTLGEKKTTQFVVGFAAETNNVEDYAKKKLHAKNADLLIANDVTQSGAGFGSDTNIVTIFDRDGAVIQLPKMEKVAVAKEILLEIFKRMK